MTFQTTFTIKELLDAGVHFGHKVMRWNPKMAPYLYGSRDDVHVIDLQQTVPLMYRALQAVYNVIKGNGRVLFVGTKKQASDIIAESAQRCGQYYVNHRWLGGMLTNWPTISKSINTMRQLEQVLKDAESQGALTKLTKKEILDISRKKDKLEKSLGGIRDMGGKPDLLFVIDTNKESLAIQEAIKLEIPIIAILDSNSNPDNIDYPVPGNDDATRAIRLYCKLISDAALAGIQDSLVASGADVGAAAELTEGAKRSDHNDKAIKPIKNAAKKVATHNKSDVAVASKKPRASKPVEESAGENKDAGSEVA